MIIILSHQLSTNNSKVLRSEKEETNKTDLTVASTNNTSCIEAPLTSKKSNKQKRTVKVYGLDGKIKLKNRQVSEQLKTSCMQQEKKIKKEEINSIPKPKNYHAIDVNDDKENISSNIKPSVSPHTKDVTENTAVQSASKDFELNSSVNTSKPSKIRKMNRIFVPKKKKCHQEPKELKLEIKISNEKSVSYLITLESNPLLIADNIANEISNEKLRNGEEFPAESKCKWCF